jgi:hypothetical protein
VAPRLALDIPSPDSLTRLLPDAEQATNSTGSNQVAFVSIQDPC